MTPKWTIRKYAVSSLGNEVALPWMLFQPGVIPPKTFHEAYWAACSMGETPSEVFAYVESQICKARTVEVVLPKVEYQKTLGFEYEDILVTRFSNSSTEVNVAGLKIALFYDDYKPLGEYLLALHYEKENK